MPTHPQAQGAIEASDDELECAKSAADGWRQLLMLHGALGDGWNSELRSYEAPTYYGMLCAAFTPSL